MLITIYKDEKDSKFYIFNFSEAYFLINIYRNS